MKDSWEIEKFGSITVSNGGDDNSDLDVYTDYQEYIADTDPTDSASYLYVQAISNNFPATVWFFASSNRLYSLLGCTDLVSNAWNPVHDSKMGAGGDDSMSSTNNLPIEFYKLEVQLP